MIHGPALGSLVITDELSARGGIVKPLLACDDWKAAEFRLHSETTGQDIALNVEVTGRVVRYTRDTHVYAPCVRVKITFVGDGEPDEVTRGWMIL